MGRRLAIALALSVALHLGLLALVRHAGARLEPAGASSDPVAFDIVEPSKPEQESEVRSQPDRDQVAGRPVARRRAPAPRAEPAAPAPAAAEPAASPAAPESPAAAEEPGTGESGLAVASGGQGAGDSKAGGEGGAGGGDGLGAGGGDPSAEPGGGGGGAVSMLMEIRRLLAAQANGCYPRAAQRFHLQGTAKVHFCVTEHGAPRGARVIESSGSPLLDEGALCVVARAAPYPLTSICLSVPIDFVMDR